jgi:nucleoside-diphosphate-sugar epimerase
MGKNITIHELPMTPGSTPRRCPDTSKIEKLTKYTPNIPLRVGLLKTYQWYRDKLDNPYE